MASKTMSNAFRRSLRSNNIRKPTLARSYRTPTSHNITQQLKTPALLYTMLPSPRLFSSSTLRYVSILPDSSDPPPREAEEHDDQSPTQKTDITIEEYHTLADEFLETLIAKLEQRQEEKGDMDVEYSVRHVMITIPLQ